MKKVKWQVFLGVCLALLVGMASLWVSFDKNVSDSPVLTTIWPGSSGTAVRDLQRQLLALGYDASPADGVYGDKTRKAVKAFQGDHRLTADGIAGTDTQRLIRSILGLPLEKTAAKPVAVATPAKSSVNVSGDLYLLAQTIHAEARGEPYIGQVAVGAVIMNRIRSPKFPNTIAGVVFQPLAFTAVADGQIYLSPNQTSIRAATDALSGWDPTGGALYYFNPSTATSSWIWTRPQITAIGKHIFTR